VNVYYSFIYDLRARLVYLVAFFLRQYDLFFPRATLQFLTRLHLLGLTIRFPRHNDRFPTFRYSALLVFEGPDII
jgi:hypothetical protein